jgi:hypothetical protein
MLTMLAHVKEMGHLDEYSAKIAKLNAKKLRHAKRGKIATQKLEQASDYDSN